MLGEGGGVGAIHRQRCRRRRRFGLRGGVKGVNIRAAAGDGVFVVGVGGDGDWHWQGGDKWQRRPYAGNYGNQDTTK